ncbi:foldase protein PrsA [Paenibacillus shirakamiensis]|uniref:Foldase protein PrsA n=1 Tax=Paenibacillus shirakamiensis TaxID=1265935 RepID=A0ABS4JLX0_9BACL|nr:peptidylprolyl isomerase [Paenibacillus shirakamiensis]MBP2002707.1 foldase protein PrsA [Paenibacillus shirakamiensis]
MLQSKSRTWRTLLIALIAVMAFSIMAGCSKKDDTATDKTNTTTEQPKDTSKVVATYEGGQITANQFDLQQRIMLLLSPDMEQFAQVNEFREYMLKQEIAYDYLAKKADDKAKQAGEKKATDQLAAIKKQVKDAEFKKMLDAKKITEAEVKAYMVKMFTVVESETAKVTDAEIAKEFETKKKDYTTATVRHILITLKDANGKDRTDANALKLAKELKAKLDKGADFGKLAKEYSEDPGSKDKDGLYTDVAVGEWVEQFKQAALTLPLNKISDPVKTDYGYHVMRVEARSEKTYDQLTQEQKDTLKTSVAATKLDTFMQNDLPKLIKKTDLPKVETKTEDSKTTTPSTTTPNTTEPKTTK